MTILISIISILLAVYVVGFLYHLVEGHGDSGHALVGALRWWTHEPAWGVRRRWLRRRGTAANDRGAFASIVGKVCPREWLVSELEQARKQLAESRAGGDRTTDRIGLALSEARGRIAELERDLEAAQARCERYEIDKARAESRLTWNSET